MPASNFLPVKALLIKLDKFSICSDLFSLPPITQFGDKYDMTAAAPIRRYCLPRLLVSHAIGEVEGSLINCLAAGDEWW